MSEILEALHDGRRVGRLTQESDRLAFAYAEEWRDRPDAFPLSLSMPLARRDHPDSVVRPFVSGLLPDDGEVLRRWGQRFHVSPRNPFRLLAHVGEECAGAIQFVPPERSAPWLDGSPPEGIDWLTDGEVADRVEALVRDRSVARRGGDEGQFSLAGAQAKTALYRDPDSGRWGIPKGATPTTHILKPNLGDFESFEINEHFCLQLAARLGLRAAHSWTETIGKTPVIVVERYDRARLGGRLVRVHQEDFCQALGRAPENKYQNEGGPAAKEIFTLIREHSSQAGEDEARFLDTLIFNYLIGGTDAHAKNFSLLLAGGGQVRLAPCYDLLSILPYDHEPKKVKLAMTIGGDYLLWKIGNHHWETAAAEWKLDPDLVRDRLIRMANAMPEAAQEIGDAASGSAFIRKLVAEIRLRADECWRHFSATKKKDRA
ncbi:MAG: type II toxin-antitoxin system HipA family toxin [Verrucomicrobiae bacterium]|nr:type II toxin-antitoxin system HipA family toxin [Verrucomicrobiae bacterium]